MCLQPQAPAPQATPAPILHQPVQAVPQQHLQQGMCHFRIREREKGDMFTILVPKVL